MSKVWYLAKRVVQTVFILWIVLTGLFFLFRLMPGSYTDLMLVQGASPESVANFERKWGLNDPIHIQYFKYVINFLQMDLGHSLQFGVPVSEYLRMKIFNSFILIAPAITCSYILGTIIGTVIGVLRDSKYERYINILVITFGTIPSFFLGIVLIVVFAGWLDWFPTSGMMSATAIEIDARWYEPYLSKTFIHHYFLPFMTIALNAVYLPTLVMRTNVIETLGQDFIHYHRLTGRPKFDIYGSIAKHSILPVITLYPVSMTRAIGGLVLVEIVFNWPGVGFALVEAVLSRDFPVIQFAFFLVAFFVIIGNFLVDIVYGVIDPRISIEK